MYCLKCTDLEVMGSNPALVELGMHRTSALVVFEPKLLLVQNT